MTIYLDRDFDAATLADLLTQVQIAATEEWFLHLESEVWHTYRDLARADVKAGRSTAVDHPDLSPGAWFRESDFDVLSSPIVKFYAEALDKEVLHQMSPLFDPKFGLLKGE